MPLQIVSPQSRVFPNTLFLHEFIHRQRTMDKFAAGGTPLSLPAIPQNTYFASLSIARKTVDKLVQTALS